MIASVVVEQSTASDPPEQKPVVRFAGLTLGLVLNKTNAATVAATLGYNTDSWIGATLRLRSEMVQFRGQFKPGPHARVECAANCTGGWQASGAWGAPAASQAPCEPPTTPASNGGGSAPSAPARFSPETAPQPSSDFEDELPSTNW